ncbi:hypothetical protein EVI01_24250 [Enterococcus villorum]|uniref:Uncharacterized protein n=1 Tax=Enterococcus villorum TaxID=112904 RepID=A0A511J502_9ENTE|nr:hypothetical protein EVI01_24250 [Enterococcus villorum]
MTKWLSYPFFYEYTVFLKVTSSKARSEFYQNLRNNFQKNLSIELSHKEC